MTSPFSSDFFQYRNNELYAEETPLRQIAQKMGTPTFAYSKTAIINAFTEIDEALTFAPHRIAYAVKANGNLAVLRTLAKLGAGADIVSGGELEKCLKAGFEPSKIVFSGVGKTSAELERALEVGIDAVHIESPAELDMLETAARKLDKVATIALRINPDVDPQTHPYISTGLHTTKFGLEIDVARELIPRILNSKSLRLTTIACHIGSQMEDPSPIRDAVEIVAKFADECTQAGAPIEAIDAGGGWPIAYSSKSKAPTYSEFGKAIKDGIENAGMQDRGWRVQIEPGRSVVGAAGTLLTKVVLIKEQAGKRFVVVDAAMTDLLRPALYQAHHEIALVNQPTTDVSSWEKADVVGPVCETADFLALDRQIPDVKAGDLLAVGAAGAYAAVMGSSYNARQLPAEVMVEGSTHTTVRRRESIEDLWRLES